MADYNSIYTGEEIDASVGNAKTAADLKTAYESNADTNAFTDAEQAKLANQSGVNTGDQDISGIATNASDILALESEQITQNSAIALNTAKRTYPLVDENKLAGIEDGADVTDVTNVTAAGAVMTDSNATLDSLQLNGGVSAEGTFAWNDQDGTVDLNLKGGNVTLQIGQEEVVRVVNGTGTNLLESQYRAVKVIGAQGQRLQVDFALADSDVNSVTTIGVVTESIFNNQEGFITTNGIVRGINTTGSLQGETWVDGDVLYLSPTIEGTLTNIKPTTPAHLIVIGYVVHKHITQGKIFVKVDNGYELEELHDVLITSITDNELLQYNSAGGYWENQTLAEAGIATSDEITNLQNTKQNNITLTTIGTSGAATLIDDTLNIPNYAGGGGGGGGTVTEVTTNAPLSVTNGTTTPDLSISQATTLSDGYLSSTDWNTFNSKLSSGENVSELTNDAGYLTSAPVDSVAGKTGVVTLVKSDITDFSDGDYATAAQGALADSSVQPSDNISTLINDSNYLPSNPTGVTGADIVSNIMSLTQVEYDAIGTPNASTLYIING